MAIFHFSVGKPISRKLGQSSVAAAAYRAGEKIKDERTGIIWDFTHKKGVVHSEVLSPDTAPEWIHDRTKLWNAVESVEKRKDAQLARNIEMALPVELDLTAQVSLMRDYVKRHFVDHGMTVDLAIHHDNPHNPHAHLLVGYRSVNPKGFGWKNRSWNTRSMFSSWRVGWAETTNEHLARAGLSVRIDHRTLAAQGIRLAPGRKIGAGLQRQQSNDLPRSIVERVAEQREIARANGAKITADPTIAVGALTKNNAIFTEHDVAKWLHGKTDGADQFREAQLKVMTSSELVPVGYDDRGRKRYTGREMLKAEADLLQRAETLASRAGHKISADEQARGFFREDLSREQRLAYAHLVDEGDLKNMVGVAGSGKSRLLSAARESWEKEGYTVKGMTLSGIAAENLTRSSGIQSRTIASYEHAWKHNRDHLTSRDVLVLDEAGMVGTRQLGGILEAADRAGAKVVLAGDPEQLQPIEAGAAFRAVVAQTGAVELSEVRRQIQPWQQDATRKFFIGKTTEALQAYARRGSIRESATKEQARTQLLSQWTQDSKRTGFESRIMLALTRADARDLNRLAHSQRRDRGELGPSEIVKTAEGMREFSVNDRLVFLHNERSLNVKNGMLGTIQRVDKGLLEVQLDGRPARVVVDTKFYDQVDHGYALTTHKAQSMTVDHSYVLATPHYDKHSAYVAMSRHREDAVMFYAAEDFGGDGMPRNKDSELPVRQQFLDVLSRHRDKEFAHDYLDRELGHRDIETPRLSFDESKAGRAADRAPSRSVRGHVGVMSEMENTQQRAAERWREKQRSPEPAHPAESKLSREANLDPSLDASHDSEFQHNKHPKRPSLEDDLEL